MRFSFIEAQKAVFSINLMCKVLRVARSGYYAWRGREESARARRDRQLAVKIRAFHEASRGTYGSPRILDDLKDDGETVGRKRVARIMRQEDLTGQVPRQYRRTTDSKHNLPVAENIVDRNFDPKAPNQVWAADITYIRTWEGWLYVAVVLDLFSRRVVGWAIADHMRTELVLDAFMMAVEQRRPFAGLVHHSDRGSQYASHAYQDALGAHDMVCSMSRKGDCWDNSVVESFFGTLKEDLIHRHSWPTKSQAKRAIAEYIICFYNSHRRHSYIDNISPIEYEMRAFAA
jgi:transposase InsO family protein